MKNKSWLVLGLAVTAITIGAQTASTTVDSPIGSVSNRVSPIDANSSALERTMWVTNAVTGEITQQKHSYISVEAGLNYRDEAGQWRASQELIELTDDGGAAAMRGQHKVHLGPNLNTAGVITLTTVSNRVFRSHPLGLYYVNAQTGERALIARLKDSIGELHPPNIIVYPDCLDGAKADYRVTYTKAGVEADLVLLAQLPAPELFFGTVNRQAIRVEWVTEFLNPPAPEIRSNILKRQTDLTLRQTMAEPDLVDETLDFHDLWFPQGRAFAWDGASGSYTNTLGRIRPARTSDNDQILVAKDWAVVQQRQLLVESVDLADIAPKLARLPQPGGVASAGNLKQRVTKEWRLPDPQVATVSPTKPMRVASAPYQEKGFVLDYIAAATSGTDYTFNSGTYLIGGGTYFSGTLTFQPNCVIKLGNNGYLLTYGSIVCNGTASSPSIITSKDDDLFGERIEGSSGAPSYAGNPALWLYYLSTGVTVNGMKIRWAHTAVQFDPAYDSSPYTFQNSSLEQCQTGLESCCSTVSIVNSTQCGVTTPTSGEGFTGSLTATCSGDIDADGDGLPDSWELGYFGNTTSQNATGDPDADGLTNLQEYQGGTNPNYSDATSWTGDLADVNFGGGYNGSYNKTGLAATGRSANDYWNNVLNNSPGPHRLAWVDGNISPITLTMNNTPGLWAFATSSGDPMYDIYVYPSSGAMTATLSGVPAGNYELYLYGHGGADNQNSVFNLSVGGVAQGQQQTSTTPPYYNAVWQEGRQYVVYRNLQVSVGQNLVVTVTGGVSGYALLNGLQLVRTDTDSDQDGLPDWWETQYFGDITSEDGTGDPDGDGLTNLEEYQTGRNPTVADAPPPLLNLLNLNFGGGFNGAYNKTGMAATGRSASDYWNNVPYNSPGPFTLVWSDRSAAPITLTMNTTPGIWGFATSSGDPMYDVYHYAFSGQTMTATLTGVPAGDYELYLYGHGGADNQNAVFNLSVGGVAQGQQQTATTPPYYNAAWQEGRQYVVYRNLQVNAGQNLVVTVTGGVGGYVPFNGLQLTEPGTDSDQDGLPDSWEFRYFGNITSQSGGDDADGDGLTNLQEYQLHTNPTLVDTGSTGVSDAYKDSDGDGLLNLEELKLGSNPFVPNVAALAFSPVGGSYASAQNVTITSPTAGATIHYTLDGTEPTEASSTYSGPVPVNQNRTVKAKAWKTGWIASDTETEGYRIENPPSNQGPTVAVSPPSGTSFLASDTPEILVEASDTDGTIAKVQLFRGNYKVAETTSSPLRYDLNNLPAGTYTFTAKAIDDAGAVTVSAPVTYTIAASGPVVSLHGIQPFFTSSPGTLIASVLGVNPGNLTSLTLNGNAVTRRTGEFTLTAALVEGENTFTLVATDNYNRTAQATVTVYLDSTPPTVSITAPANNSSFNTDRVNVSGTFTETSLERITVNGVPAFISGNTFEALNVPLADGANTITATAEDIAGNEATASITVTGSATPVDPVQLTATTVGGFAPLNVTFTVVNNAPGTFQQALYDFNGDNITDQTEANLNPVSHTYSTAGEYFPVVTIQTSAGRFSSPGGWNAWNPDRLRINVQSPPVTENSLSVTDPVDIKTTADGHLYVLSRSTATIMEYDANLAVVRSMSSIGATPTGLDVDSAGNVFVALSGDHQVAKFNPNGSTFALDATFGAGGLIGKSDKTSGTGNGEFNAPYDVAVSPDGTEIAVSDSGNHRVQRFKTADGSFIGSFGEQGSGTGQFNAPKGLTYDGVGYLYIVDSGNNRIALALSSSSVVGTSGSIGTTLGQFQGAVSLGTGSRGIYVAETVNNRVQAFDPIKTGHGVSPTPFNARLSLSTQLGLNQPNAIAPISDFLAEKIYIADTGNNRVIKATLPESSTPDAVWNAMKSSLLVGNIDAAIPYFSIVSAEDYRRSFISIGTTSLSAVMDKTLTPVVINGDSAQYYFEDTIAGETVTFPVEFVKENGTWKILEF